GRRTSFPSLFCYLATQERLYAKKFKGIRRYPRTRKCFGHSAGLVVHANIGQPDYILECMVLFFEVDKYRDRKLRNQMIWQSYRRRCQSIRVLIRKRMKQNTFDDAVNRGACANTQGERQDGGDCKSGTLSQHPQGITNIIPMT